MNAYELADELADTGKFFKDRLYEQASTMLRQQAKRIEELEHCLIVEQEHNQMLQHKELSDEEIQKAFNQWLMLDEGVVRFNYQLKHEWVAEQWERWQQAFKLARGEE